MIQNYRTKSTQLERTLDPALAKEALRMNISSDHSQAQDSPSKRNNEERKEKQECNKKCGLDQSLNSASTDSGRSEHIAISSEGKNEQSATQRALEAIEQAGTASSVNQVFEAGNEFTIDLDSQEVNQLKAAPTIKSMKADQPMKLNPPTEIKLVNNSGISVKKEAESTETSGLEKETHQKKIYGSGAIEGHATDPTAQGGINTSALPVYGCGRANAEGAVPRSNSSFAWHSKQSQSQKQKLLGPSKEQP